jgi:hypothetical protein
MEELKVRYLMAEKGELSYGEIMDIDSLVSDFAIYEAYGGYVFTEEDFI